MDTLLRICDLYSVNLDVLLRGSVEESCTSDTAKYDAFMNRFARRISLASAGILAGLGLAAFAEGAGLQDLQTGMIFLSLLTVCMVVLVASGIQYEGFCRKHPVIADFYTKEQRDAFRQKFVWYIAGGVGAVLIGLMLMTLIESRFGDEPHWGPGPSGSSSFWPGRSGPLSTAASSTTNSSEVQPGTQPLPHGQAAQGAHWHHLRRYDAAGHRPLRGPWNGLGLVALRRMDFRSGRHPLRRGGRNPGPQARGISGSPRGCAGLLPATSKNKNTGRLITIP